ncbi:RNase H domain-containing protein [Trichonephila clavipes]|nr:RNase H domain-containing protein [Trichonephila clavipes]
MVWGVIAYRSPLVLIRATMTAQRYVHDILQPHVLPLMQRLPGAIFQQDNAWPHTARVSQDCLRTATTLPWPARSPYLCPIEYIWDHLGQRVGHPSSLNELEARTTNVHSRGGYYSKSTVAPVVFQRVFAIYTDGSKRADYVGCGVVIEDIMHGYRLDTSCSIFTAEAVAIYRALQLIDSNMPRKYCIYTDSMSVLEALENYNDRCHPVVCKILDITSRLYSKGLDIVFCWLPSHVGIIGNEQADSAAKSATTHLPLAVPLSDMKRVIMHHIFKIWQESWSQQLDNKLHSVKPVIGAWSVMPMRRTDVKLTRLRIGHTRFTHRHLLLGEDAPECPSCKVSYTVRHILIDCPVFNTYRMTFFHTSVLTLSDLVGESPHQNLFAFIKKIGFLYLI